MVEVIEVRRCPESVERYARLGDGSLVHESLWPELERVLGADGRAQLLLLDLYRGLGLDRN
jgi:hypothetical protein